MTIRKIRKKESAYVTRGMTLLAAYESPLALLPPKDYVPRSSIMTSLTASHPSPITTR